MLLKTHTSSPRRSVARSFHSTRVARAALAQVYELLVDGTSRSVPLRSPRPAAATKPGPRAVAG